jgi:hypothetical protein
VQREVQANKSRGHFQQLFLASAHESQTLKNAGDYGVWRINLAKQPVPAGMHT